MSPTEAGSGLRHQDLGLDVGDPEVAARSRGPALGLEARLPRGRGGDHAWDVLADPEGHEFGVLSPLD